MKHSIQTSDINDYQPFVYFHFYKNQVLNIFIEFFFRMKTFVTSSCPSHHEVTAAWCFGTAPWIPTRSPCSTPPPAAPRAWRRSTASMGTGNTTNLELQRKLQTNPLKNSSRKVGWFHIFRSCYSVHFLESDAASRLSTCGWPYQFFDLKMKMLEYFLHVEIIMEHFSWSMVFDFVKG